MSSDSPVQPDVEIYVKRADTEDILSWLRVNFEVGDILPQGATIKVALSHRGAPLVCTIFPGAAKGGYVSVLFEPNSTPWATDEACAAEAFSHFNLEVRCSNGSWSDSAGDQGGWLRFTDKGRSVVNWLT